jgi:FdhD protein
MKRQPSATFESMAWRGKGAVPTRRVLPAEVAIAFVYDGSAEAVMMATPDDLEDFALGFSLNDGVIAAREELTELDIVAVEQGIELRMSLRHGSRDALAIRRRRRAGPVGCGLCGVESIADALPKLPRVSARLTVTPGEIVAAMRAMSPLQKLNAQTHAVHAAGFYVPGEGIFAVREDVGRHNALDKLAGALVRAGRKPCDGAILMTSRVSVELVQKAAMMGAPVLAAVSAPTALALCEAEAAGVTVAGIVRDDGLEIFTHAQRFHLDDGADAT